MWRGHQLPDDPEAGAVNLRRDQVTQASNNNHDRQYCRYIEHADRVDCSLSGLENHEKLPSVASCLDHVLLLLF